MARPVVLSYGLGVDSTAILLRWLTEPASRDFELSDLTVITAMTGDEWRQTGRDVEAHVLPLLAAHGVRYIQVARGQRHVSTAGDGVVTLDDSTEPARLYLEGAFKLSQEMLEAGTVPQTGGARLCSVHSKGDALDPVISRIVAGRPYRHVMGFEANEPKRAAKDRLYNTALRTGEYPLIEWGWDREACKAFIYRLTGVHWKKSACKFCPFALANTASRAETLERYATEEPEASDLALTMEYVALALNPNQALVGRYRLVDLLETSGYAEVVKRFRSQLPKLPHALYEVRRILRAQKDDPAKMANASRSVRRVAEGTADEMLDRLYEVADAEGVDVSAVDGVNRAYVRRRGHAFPTAEHFLVAAPAVVLDKAADNFEAWWAELDEQGLTAKLADFCLDGGTKRLFVVRRGWRSGARKFPEELGCTKTVTDVRSHRQGAHVGRPDRS